MSRMTRVLVATLLGLAVGSCSDMTGPGPSVLVMVAGVPAARAVQFRFVGRQTAIGAVLAGSTIFTSMPSGDTITVVVIAPAGQVLSGAVARVSVPDQAVALSDDAVVLLQLAATDYSLQSRFDYTITLKAPS